ncbi:MAG: hypothetical protein WCP92_03745 [bacterium]
MTFLSNNAKLKQNITDSLATIKTKRGVMDLTTESATGLTNMFTTKDETSSLLSPTLASILPNQSSVS